MPISSPAAKAIAAVRNAPGNRVKVAVSDIDGVLRGKYVHKDKFYSAVEGGFGFCDVVFGWDMMDVTYDNTTLTGWHKGFPDALAKIDVGTHAQRAVGRQRAVLPRRVRQAEGRQGGAAADLPAAGAEARAEARREARASRRCAEWSSSGSISPRRRIRGRDKKGVGPTTLTPGMFGYSLLRANENREFFAALMNDMAAFGVPIEGLHTETGPGVYEAAILFSEALEAADRAILFKTGAKEIGARFGIMPSFMAKWSQQYPGCSGHIHQSLSDGKKNLFHDPKGRNGDEQAVRKLPRRPGRGTDGAGTDVLADDQQLQAAGRRLLGAGEADVGRRQPHGELPRDRRRRPSPRASRRAAPAPT